MSHNCNLLKNFECSQLWRGSSSQQKLFEIGKFRHFFQFFPARCGKMGTYHQLCDDGFKKYKNKCKSLRSETLISHSILFLEQVKIIAAGTQTPSFHCTFYAAYNLMIMLKCRVVNNENITNEASTAIIKIIWIHWQVGIIQTVQRVTQCLSANIGEKPLNSFVSWHNVKSYT